MKKIYENGFVLFLSIIIMLITGCSEDKEPTTSKGIDNVVIDNVIYENCSQNNGICMFYCTISFDDNSDSDDMDWYYWIGLDGGNYYYVYRKGGYLRRTFGRMGMPLKVLYYEGIKSGYYDIKIYKTREYNIYDRYAEGGMATYTIPKKLDFSCYDCCYQNCVSEDYNYAGVAYVNNDFSILAASCSIVTCYGNLAGYTGNNNAAHSAAFASVVVDTTAFNSHDDKWALTGYTIMRVQNSTNIFKCRLSEMYVNDYDKDLYLDTLHQPPPAIGSINNYRLELDTSNGQWRHYFNDVKFRTTNPSDFWRDNSANVAWWEGEILNFEDDMPGTNNEPCIFSDLKIKSTLMPMMYNYINLFDTMNCEYRYSNKSQWMIDTLCGNRYLLEYQTSFKIWDVNPKY